MKPQDITTGKPSSLWIFGYGSLVWKPDFKYRRSQVGYIQGYKRRFWHGDNFHRGNDELVRCLMFLLYLIWHLYDMMLACLLAVAQPAAGVFGA